MTLELGHGLTSGAHYLYVDDYVFKSEPPPPPVNPNAFSHPPDRRQGPERRAVGRVR
ncbi:MAG: hypothetical protein IPG96_19355 [Proteobacteria bacterium]|nr:hypothetical protein [Pseudomonadota bacterium]